jgi:hypothetical protein
VIEYKTVDGVLHAKTQVRNPDGTVSDTYIPVGDRVGYETAKEPTSHADFFKRQEAHQRLKRAAALSHLVEQTFAGDLKGVRKKTISDQAMIDLMKNPDSWKKEGFTPVAAYEHKIRGIRGLYSGEVGVIEKDGEVTYLMLEEGYGKAILIQSNPLAKDPEILT